MAFSVSLKLDFLLGCKNNPSPERFILIPGLHFISIVERGHTIGTWEGNTPFYDSFRNSCPTIQSYFVDRKYKAWAQDQAAIATAREAASEAEREAIIHVLEGARYDTE